MCGAKQGGGLRWPTQPMPGYFHTKVGSSSHVFKP